MNKIQAICLAINFMIIIWNVALYVKRGSSVFAWLALAAAGMVTFILVTSNLPW